MLPHQIKIIIVAEILFVLLVSVYVYRLSASHHTLIAKYHALAESCQADEGVKTTIEINETDGTFTYPVVVYDHEEDMSAEELERFDAQLIGPYTLYHNELGVNVVSLMIEVPKTLGDSFRVTGIFKDGTHDTFIYGMKGDVLEYWVPLCEGELGCEFSETFRRTYPHIVEIAEAP